jgi:hypothetical protein
MLHISNKVSGKHAALQTTLLCSVSLIACSVIVAAPHAARAQTYSASQNTPVY